MTTRQPRCAAALWTLLLASCTADGDGAPVGRIIEGIFRDIFTVLGVAGAVVLAVGVLLGYVLARLLNRSKKS